MGLKKENKNILATIKEYWEDKTYRWIFILLLIMVAVFVVQLVVL